jgi:uncharacterized metal-binding protein
MPLSTLSLISGTHTRYSFLSLFRYYSFGVYVPKTQIHDVVILTTTPIVYTFTQDAVIAYMYLGAGLLLSPDLDIRSQIFKRWFFLRWYWLPYQWIVKHRSWVSHSGIVSALIRAIYISPFFYALYIYYPDLIFPLLAGMILSDCVHTLLDLVSTALLRSKNKLFKHQRR